MGQALYRKYRPRNFEETVGQEAITRTLAQAIKSGRISHAYLFAGPRGVGKTSIARILAHQINRLSYTEDGLHLDIIEIDAASNRRIDEIRDLREKVHITPTSAKYKVYIVDEVHMLTKEAFNALLKTLEEPPAHCVFILATTEAHKLPETIISRTQRFNFKPITKDAAKKHLHSIAKSESATIENEALELLAEYGEGSLRDIIGLFDQLSATAKPITEKDVRDLLGIPSVKAIDELIVATSRGDTHAVLSTLDSLKEQAASPAAVAKTTSWQLRKLLLEQESNSSWIAGLLKELLNVSSSPKPQESLELALLEAALQRTSNGQSDNIDPPLKPREVGSGLKNKPRPRKNNRDTVQGISQFKIEQWSELLSLVKSAAPSLYTALRLAKPEVKQNELELVFAYPFHQKKVKEAKHIQLISRLIEDISGAKVVISCSVDKKIAQKVIVDPILETEPMLELKTISSIFGSAEVLES